MLRREFLRRAAATAGALVVTGRAGGVSAQTGTAIPGPGPYGALRPPDANGVRVPAGFTSRIIARSGHPVEGTDHQWHNLPDGGAVFPADDGGWIYVSNSEMHETGAGGVSAVRFDADGNIVDAYPVLSGTTMNCSGGPTPWGTWLSCEEHESGRVWECDPTGNRQPKALDAMGAFTHEAAAIDPRPRHERVYLTEDADDGCFYRFTPKAYPDLSEGVLEVAIVEGFETQTASAGGKVRWARVPSPVPDLPGTGGVASPTRQQVLESTRFDGGEGIVFDGSALFFSTKGDNRIWRYVPDSETMQVLYSAGDFDDPPLSGVDNVTVAPSGDVYIAEDGGDMQVVAITSDGVVAPFLQLTDIDGIGQRGSEVAGPAFTPDGTRLYFSSQRAGDRPSIRAAGVGVTYEVTGPFRDLPVSEQPQPRPSPSDGIAAIPSSTPVPVAPSAEPVRLPAIGGALVAVGAAVAAVVWRRRRGDV